MTRHEARKQAFYLLFQMEFQKVPIEDVIAQYMEAGHKEPNGFTKELCFGVSAHLQEIDELIGKYSRGWKKSRIPKVTLSVLRVALFEMKHMKETPYSVSINEAVELCKEFATPDDGAFVNGILSSVAKEEKPDGV